MAIDTSLSGVGIFNPPENQPESTSFLHSYERAQEQKSPLYLAQVQQMQAAAMDHQFQAVRNQLGLEMDRFTKQQQLAGMASIKSMADIMSGVTDRSTEDYMPKLYQELARNPTPAGEKFVAAQDAARNAALAAQDRAEKIQLDLAAKVANVQLGYEKAKSSAEISQAKLEAAQAKISPQQSEREDFAKLQKQQEALATLVQTNPKHGELKTMLKEVQSKLEAFGLQHRGGLSATLQYDDQGRPIINLGEGKATVGTQTAVQTELANLKNSVVQIDNARNVLTEKDLGVAGNIWDVPINRYIAQVIPGASDPAVSSNRAQLQKAVDTYLQSQQTRGRLSAAERADVRDALVTRNLGESLPRAQSVLATMSRIQKQEAISRAKTGQQPLQSWMFEGLTQTEIKSLIHEGVLTLDEGLPWASKAPKKK